MKFNFNNFMVQTEQEEEQLSELISAPTSIENGKPTNYILKPKTRNLTVFKLLAFYENNKEQYFQVISDLFDFIDLIEVLKAYSGKRLEANKEYKFNGFSAKIATKNEVSKLRVSFDNFETVIFLDKFECSSLAAKFSKVVQRCESWQE
jgi:hypothetical protein